jgi:hypothetical protein
MPAKEIRKRFSQDIIVTINRTAMVELGRRKVKKNLPYIMQGNI